MPVAGLRTIVVLGAGAEARSIAYLAAKAGYRTILEDLSGQMAGAAMEEIRARAQEERAEDLLERLETGTAIDEAAGRAELIIEAAPDDFETKTEIYTLIDRASPPGCIFAATTSMVPISEIAALTYRAPQVLAMRFSDPIVEAKRLEIVRCPETSDETVQAAGEVGRRMGKQVVVLRER